MASVVTARAAPPSGSQHIREKWGRIRRVHNQLTQRASPGPKGRGRANSGPGPLCPRPFRAQVSPTALLALPLPLVVVQRGLYDDGRTGSKRGCAMRLTYLTLYGDVLDLTGLNDEEWAFFDRCIQAFRNGMPRPEYSALLYSVDNPA